MSSAELLARLADVGAFLTVGDRGRLRFHGPAAALTDEVRNAIRERRDAVVAFLRKSSADMTDAELAALGFVPNGRGIVMLPPGTEELEGGWSPPGWGEEARVG